ncbi:MAG: hypothetical protein FWE68_03400, partial [Defluviitaleaceae bacterium]|nr:hypothetical protein [Defluviitaleaceae bacterium]
LRDGNNGFYGRSDNITSTLVPGATPADNVYTLRIFDLDKWDFGAEGLIELIDANGARIEVHYSSLDYDGLNAVPPYIEVTLERPAGMHAGTFNQFASNPSSVSIGRSTNFKGIPHYINKLNELVRNFARAINEGLDANGDPIPHVIGHINGFDANGNSGNLFFTFDPRVAGSSPQTTGGIPNYLLMNAANFMVSPDLARNPSLLAASDDPDPSSPTDESNNKLILSLTEIRHFTSLFREGRLADFVLGISSELGIDVRQAKRFEQNYAEIVAYVDNQRLSYSGVSLDEEMMNMIKYQQLYQAAAKLTNVIDGIYDTVINRLGLVGR